MYKHSHGFRPGRSQITASHEIQAAWRAGYHWVYESDLKDFFDSVNLSHLKDRLNAIYLGDPIVDRIIDWMKASVKYDGKTIDRQNGLPQSSPLSPLMANLMLDDFDNDMKAAGFYLTRFADDFIVLCKDPDEAKKAEQAALKSLQEHGLELHPDKTKITALEEGFKYLGYLFVNDMALDISANKTDHDPNKTTLTANSWLANIAEHQAPKLTKQDSLTKLIENIAQTTPINISNRENSGTIVKNGRISFNSNANKQIQVY